MIDSVPPISSDSLSSLHTVAEINKINKGDKHMSLDLIKPRGVFREKETDDIKLLVNNFTAPALAEALRDRETTLQRAAALLFNNDINELKELLNPFLDENVAKRRLKKLDLNLSQGFTRKEIVILQRYICLR
jgi:hypothetical protein